jgi:hypothetical protein
MSPGTCVTPKDSVKPLTAPLPDFNLNFSTNHPHKTNPKT